MKKVDLLSLFRSHVFFITALILLGCGFYLNAFKVTPQKRFNDFQKESESYVIGRILIAERVSLFYRGGLTGSIFEPPNTTEDNLTQYDIYTNNIPLDSTFFHVYGSQIGGQGLTFALLAKISPFSKPFTLSFFWLATAMLTALIFTLFLQWVKKNFGLSTAIISLALIILSSWITVFAKNLWWVLWNFYVPFIAFLLLLERNGLMKFKQISLISFVTFFIKCFFSGYEYITTILLMSICPFLYYAVLQKWNFKSFLYAVLSFSTGAISAILLSFCILAFQISKVAGSIKLGFQHIYSSFFRRSYGDPSDFPEAFREPLRSNVFDVLSKYWNGIAFDLNNFFINSSWKSFWQIDYGELIIIFMLFSSLLFNFKLKTELRQRNIALLLTTWFSFLAPVSWFAVFKAHSYVHLHMNFITWYMPFALFGYVIIGKTISLFINRTKEFYTNTNKKLA